MDCADFYDAELRAHHAHLRAACGIKAGDDVLDIGCGAGLTTREAARAAAPGRVVGIDISPAMLERARRITSAERIGHIEYQLGYAQTHRFPPGSFDVAISRFGVMFFGDPEAAFANIAAALHPGARLVLLVWQRSADNEWARTIADTLGAAARPAPPHLDPFSLADRDATTRLLEQAGFDRPRFADVRAPVYYGTGVEDALQTVLGFQTVSEALAALDPDERDRAIGRLRTALIAHHEREDGVVFDGRSWLITARRR